MAVHVHVRYNLCRPLLNKHVKSPNSALSGEREPRRLIVYIFISNLSLCRSVS